MIDARELDHQLGDRVTLSIIRGLNTINEHPRARRVVTATVAGAVIVAATLRIIDQYHITLPISDLLQGHLPFGLAATDQTQHGFTLHIGQRLGCTIDPINGAPHIGITEDVTSPIPHTTLFSTADTISGRQFVDLFHGTSARNTYAIPSAEVHPGSGMFRMIGVPFLDSVALGVKDSCGTGPERVKILDVVSCYLPHEKCVDLGGAQNGAIMQQLTVRPAK